MAIDPGTKITVVGAGIVGLWQAYILSKLGGQVCLIEKSSVPFADTASRWAAAMIAPECESEDQPEVLQRLGRRGLEYWRQHYPNLNENGTLVIAAARDSRELDRFSKHTERHRMVTGKALAEIEPELADRYDRALFFENEAHANADEAMNWLLSEARSNGASVSFDTTWQQASQADGTVIDCRGMAAASDIDNLRGVRGERILVKADDVTLSRPVRLLHPRQPIYIVPQGNGLYVIGATVIEREDQRPITLRSVLDLLAAAYTVHTGFSESEIVEMGVGVRPALSSNLPAVIPSSDNRILHVNGTYRHGFLLAPVLAEAVSSFLKDGTRHELFTS